MADEVTTQPQTPAQGTKQPWESKTIIINSLLGILVAISPFVAQAQPIATWINAHGIELGVAWSGLNLALRFITKDKIVLGD